MAPGGNWVMQMSPLARVCWMIFISSDPTDRSQMTWRRDMAGGWQGVDEVRYAGRPVTVLCRHLVLR